MKRTLLTLILFCVAVTVWAQKGYLRGKVLDAETGEALIGATISKQGTSTGTVADFEGNYSLPLEPGTHTIVFQFVSYQTKTVENIVIEAEKVNTLDINLSTDVQQLAEVVVQAEVIKDNEAALLKIQKKSANVLDGISAQSFRKIGDSNLSGAMKRVTGVAVQGGKYVYVRGLGDRYTRTTLNGMSIPGLDPERNDVQIDLFPTSILENVIVYKTFSPELAGDFTGGTVNVETKSFPEEKFTRLSLGVGYNPNMHFNDDFVLYDGSSTDFLGFDGGDRELPIDNPEDGVPRPTSPEPGAQDQLEAVTRKLDPQMAASKRKSFMNTSFSFNHGNQIDKESMKIGYGVVLNYQNQYEYYDDAEFNLYFKDANPDIRPLDLQIRRKGQLGRNNILWSALVSGAVKFNNSEFGVRILRTQNAITEATDRVKNDVEETGQTVFQDVLTYSQRSLTSPTIYGKFKFDKLQLEVSNAVTIARVYDPDFRNTEIAETSQGEDTQYSIDGGDGGSVNRFWRDLNEFNENFRADATYELNDNNKLQFGLAGLLKWREFETYAFNLRNTNTIENDPDVLLQPENIWTPETRSGTYLEGSYEPANNYEARSGVYAAYLMNDMQVTDKFRAIYGVRVEQATMNYTGRNFNSTLVFDDEETLNEMNFLPSVNLVYSVTENMNIRTSYGRTLARPSFREKSISQILDPVSGITFSGNIDLEQTNIDNFDLRIENFFGRDEMVAVSGFYKMFDGHIEQVRYQIEPREVTWQNIGGSTVYGVELEFRKNLDFLVPGLSAGSNVSLAKSTVDTKEIIVFEDALSGEQTTEFESRQQNARTGETVEDSRNMAGQAPYLVNAYFNFSDNEGINNINLSFNVQGESLSVVGVGNVPDVYTQPFHSLNFNASRKFGGERNSQITLGINNILDDKREEMWQNFGAEDQVFSRLAPGRTFSVKYSYTF